MTGDPTFLFSDIEGSTRLWEEHPSLMREALERHDSVVRRGVEHHGGVLVKHTGDGVVAVFPDPNAAVLAAIDIQHSLAAFGPSEVEPLRVRMGIHGGPAVRVGEDYFGPTLNRCARLMAAAHGGQVVVTEHIRNALRDELSGFDLCDLGTHYLRDVPEPVQLHQVTATGLESDFPPLRTTALQHHNLPAPISTFIGRVKALESLDEELRQRRLVTVVGAGGCGKSRLAVEAAAARLSQHTDGACLVDLTEVPSGGLVPQEVAAALRVQERGDRSMTETLCATLERADVLIVLDTCEHVIDGVAALAAQLLRSCPGVRILATSRAPLGIAGEALFALGPLDVWTDDRDAGASDAVQLFLERASLVRPNLPHAQELATIERICRRLEGIPLAIELACARLNVLSLEQLESRLERRFELLTTGPPTSERHRTLRRTVEWSYDLLDEEEQRAWSWVSVFLGSFDLEGAAAVLDADEAKALAVLTSLVNKSIIQATVGGSIASYRMLDTLRDFGREQLVESDTLVTARRRLRSWAVRLAAQAAPEHMSDEGPRWHNRLEDSFPNLRLALESALEDGAPGEAVQLCADLGLFLWLRGHLTDGRDWCERALGAASPGDKAVRARAMLSLGLLAYGQLDFPACREKLEAAVDLAGAAHDKATVGWASIFLAVVHASSGDAETARSVRDEALRIADVYVSQSVRAAAYYMAGSVDAVLGDDVAAQHRLRRTMDIARDAGSPYTLARLLPPLARRLEADGDSDGAIAAMDEAIALTRSTGDRVGLARSLRAMAAHHIARAEYEKAGTRLREALPIVSLEIDDASLACRVETTAGTLCRVKGDLRGADAHLERALARAARLGVWRSSMDPFLARAELEIAREDNDAALEALASSKNAARHANHAGRLLTALILESSVLLAAARLDDARRTLAEAETRIGAVHEPVLRAQLDHVRGRIALADGRPEDAVHALRAAERAADAAGIRLLAIECREDLALAWHSLNPADDAPRQLAAAAADERRRIGAPPPDARRRELVLLDATGSGDSNGSPGVVA